MKYLLILLVLNTFAVTDDSDLTDGRSSFQGFILDHVISPNEKLITLNTSGETTIKVILKSSNGKETIINDIDFETNCSSSIAIAKFDNKFYRIKNRQNYELQGHIDCGSTNTWFFEAESPEGQVIGIYNILNKALNKFKTNDIISFWTRKITIKFPGAGDYYNWNTINITRGDYWDVVGHELGHAIYDQGDIGAFGGGSHKIDECYSHELALSEGWASYFSAWLSIDLDDSDAKFEFMVPRRSPLNIEHIPSDVCAGPRNEWRVTGFLWDLIDHSEDGETSKILFSQLWRIALNKKYNTIKEMAQDVVRKGFDPILMNIIWEQNFLEQY